MNGAKGCHVPAVAPHAIGIEHKLAGNSRFRYMHVRIVAIERDFALAQGRCGQCLMTAAARTIVPRH